jgi:hypothetical protein
MRSITLAAALSLWLREFECERRFECAGWLFFALLILAVTGGAKANTCLSAVAGQASRGEHPAAALE